MSTALLLCSFLKAEICGEKDGGGQGRGRPLNVHITHKELEPDEEGRKKSSKSYRNFGQRLIEATKPPTKTMTC